jgi:HlyD family secretion protein
VVTYNAIIDVPNPQLKLKPGMTANVKILIEKVEDVLKIPNSSMRFRPTMSDPEMEAAYKRGGEEKYYAFTKAMAGGGGASAGAATATAGGPAMPGGGGNRGGFGGGGSAPRRDPAAAMNRSTRGRRIPVWILGEDKLLRPTVVKLGLTDGVSTEIADGKLKQGDKIIIGLEVDPNRPAATSTTRPPGFGGPMGGMGGGPRR